MKNKSFLLGISILCAVLMASCAGEADGESQGDQQIEIPFLSGTSSENAALNGSHTYYIPIDDSTREIWNDRVEDDLDDVLEAIYNRSSEKQEEENIPFLLLDHQSFKSAWGKYRGEGSYRIENQCLHFDWSDFYQVDPDMGEIEDNVVFPGTLDRLNQHDIYPFLDEPAYLTFDKNVDLCFFPEIMQNFRSRMLTQMIHFDVSAEIADAQLKVIDNLICSSTYGLSTDGMYQTGKPFRLQFDSQIIDEAFYSNNSKSYTELLSIHMALNGMTAMEDTKSYLAFSDHTWGWYTGDGELINSGAYQESQNTKGLISVYLTDDSQLQKIADSIGSKSRTRVMRQYRADNPLLLLYIAEDGTVYYPEYFTSFS